MGLAWAPCSDAQNLRPPTTMGVLEHPEGPFQSQTFTVARESIKTSGHPSQQCRCSAGGVGAVAVTDGAGGGRSGVLGSQPTYPTELCIKHEMHISPLKNYC